MRSLSFKVLFFSVLFLLMSQMMVDGQEIRVASGTYEFFPPEYMSREQARKSAVENAKLRLLADEFGTLVGSVTSTSVSSRDGKSTSNTFEVGESEVQGEWIETIGEPGIKWDIRNGTELVVIVTIKGRVRELENNLVEFEAKALRNGADENYESETFFNNDNLSILFRSPMSGYLSMFLIENEDDVYRILPYSRYSAETVPVNGNRKYVFFSTDDNSQHNLRLFTDDDIAFERLFVIFSSDPYVLPIDEAGNNMIADSDSQPGLSYKDFQSWLVKNRKRDRRMSVKVIDFSLNGEKNQ